MLNKLKSWAQTIKRDVLALYLAMNDHRVPWYAKALATVVAGYALSPIDLIPDFIPIIGYLDDLILVPLGVLLVVRLIPEPVMDDLRNKASIYLTKKRPKIVAAAVIVVFLWIVAAGAVGFFFFNGYAESQ